jgi:hypothetical protein
MAFIQIIGFRGDERGKTVGAICLSCFKTFACGGKSSDIDLMAASHACDEFDLRPLKPSGGSDPGSEEVLR